MRLIPVSIKTLKNESSIGRPNVSDQVCLTFELEVIGSGDFSDFVVDGNIDPSKIAIALLHGDLSISLYSDLLKSLQPT